MAAIGAAIAGDIREAILTHIGRGDVMTLAGLAIMVLVGRAVCASLRARS